MWITADLWSDIISPFSCQVLILPKIESFFELSVSEKTAGFIIEVDDSVLTGNLNFEVPFCYHNRFSGRSSHVYRGCVA